MGQHRERNLARVSFRYIPKNSCINLSADPVGRGIDLAEMGQVDRPREIAQNLDVQTTSLHACDKGSYT